MLNIVFVQDNAINESLALTELSGCLLAAGHRTRLLLTDHEPDVEGELRRFSPALAVIPCPVTGHETALAQAHLVKKLLPDCMVVFGGTHASLDPEIARQPDVDVVVVGEADDAVVALAGRLAAGKDWRDVPNLAFVEEGELRKNPLGPLVEPLDRLAMPDRDLYYRYHFIGRFPWKKFTTGRGCIHACSFCWNPTVADLYHQSRGSFTRRKSPRRAVDEVLAVKARYPLRSVHFSDDLFTVKSSWLEEFAPLYKKEVGVPFSCNSSIELATDRNMKALAEAGCRCVCIGLETGNEKLRSKILNKSVSNDDVRRAGETVHRYGMELATFNMLAAPGETLEDAFATIRLNQEIKADHVRVNIAVPLPHTEFERRAVDEGFLDASYLTARANSLEHPTVAFKTADARAFENLFYLFRLAVHFPALDPVIRRAVHLPITPLLDPLRLMIPYGEKRLNNLRWRDGLLFFRHIGDPHKRNSNYPTLI
jgi:anaerobic magnesium-protoporphyrin IX monomethyl ester cyclase